MLPNDYRINNGVLSKSNLNESRHLLWKFGGVPAIRCDVWDTHHQEIDRIIFKTQKQRTFTISAEQFELYKQRIQIGIYEPQYVVSKEHWKITQGTLKGQKPLL